MTTMMQKLGALIALTVAALMGGSAFPALAEDDPTDLGPGKEEFEIGAKGGTYRFEYVTQGEDGYRVVFWRQSTPLSDDSKDQGLAASVVSSVFLNRFCKDVKKPVSLTDGSPAPTGKIGIWTASLRCAEPPPGAKKAAAEKAKKVKDQIVVEKPKAGGAAGEDAGAETKSKDDSAVAGSSDTPAKAEKKPAAPEYDGPMTCTRTDDGYACRPAKG